MKNNNLFPLRLKERRFLNFVYATLATHGRVPRMRESMNYFGWPLVNKYNRMLDRLNEQGWIVKDAHWGWWPVGVDRTLSFNYPATLLLPKAPTSFVQVAAIQQAPGEPQTLQRLDNLAKLAQSFGLHHDDALTIQWAVDKLNEIGAAIRDIGSVRGAIGLNRKMDHRIIPNHMIMNLIEATPGESLTQVDFAILSEEYKGLVGVDPATTHSGEHHVGEVQGSGSAALPVPQDCAGNEDQGSPEEAGDVPGVE